MPRGPGKYDDECTSIRLATQAQGIVLVVFDGHLGTGFSVQAPLAIQHRLPEILEGVAKGIRADLAGLPKP